MNISIIIPAYNAAETIAETLESVRKQTFQAWEVIVVDDGSTDDTAVIVNSFIQQDGRFHLVHQSNRGGSAARNKGIANSRYDWLLFLDADDLLLPHHLERLISELAANPHLDAVRGGWLRLAVNGELVQGEQNDQIGDLFPLLARRSLFLPFTCLVRRSLVESVGGFDDSFSTCQDWDFWQRVARTGALFGAVSEIVGYYRMRPGSVSTHDPFQLLANSLKVITNGHALDPRVAHPVAAYQHGLYSPDLDGVRLIAVCWPAGFCIAQGKDPRPLLDLVEGVHYPDLDPTAVADCLLRAIPFGKGLPFSAWEQLWPRHQRVIEAFLLALEAHALAPALAVRTFPILARLVLERLAAASVTLTSPLSLGNVYVTKIELTEPIPHIFPPSPADRLHCLVELESNCLGVIELPVCDGLVSRYVLADAIADRFAWVILGRFLERTLYPQCRVEEGPEGHSLWRGDVLLAHGLPPVGDTFWTQVHDQAGWTVFLQELWGRPDWSGNAFYNPPAADEPADPQPVNNEWLVVEVSAGLPDVLVSGTKLNVVLTVGGRALGVVPISVDSQLLTAPALLAELTKAAGFELCRIAVREGLLGRPLDDPTPLRARLATAAQQAAQANTPNEKLRLQEMTQGATLDVTNIPTFAPGVYHILKQALSPGEAGVVLGRRHNGEIGTAASRWASLPAAAVGELIAAATVIGEPVIQTPSLEAKPTRVIYAPELIYLSAGQAGLAKRPNAVTAKLLVDEPDQSGYDWPVPFGAKEIGETFSQIASLRLMKELRTPLYRVQLFQYEPRWRLTFRRPVPQLIEMPQPTPKPSRMVATVLGEEGISAHNTPDLSATNQLPILRYHRIVPEKVSSPARYQLTATAFEEQLCYLRDAGYYSIQLEEWQVAMETKRPLPGRAILLTFDGGYQDFQTYAWPLLQQYGFLAMVFLVADAIGLHSHWDTDDDETPLLDWTEIRQLQREGVTFGSHSLTHPFLTGLSLPQLVREATRSRVILEQGLGVPVRAFAYPYGDTDPVVQHLVGACGYTFGLSCRPSLSRFQDSLLALPRIEVKGSDDLEQFVRQLNL